MKVCKSWREFNKILRKYIPRLYGTKNSIIRFRKWRKTHYCWICYRVTTIEQAQDLLKRVKYKVNLPQILREFIRNNGELVYGSHYDGKFIGIEITDEDYYYIIYDNVKNKTMFESCAGSLNYV